MRSPVREFIGAVPALMWTVTLLYLLVLLAYSLLLPPHRAPDEPLHVDLSHHMSESFSYPAWDERDLGPGLSRSLRLTQFHGPRNSAHLTADEAQPKDERPSFEQMDEPAIETSPNQLPQHPPLYYLLTGGAGRLVDFVDGNDPSYDLEIWSYRLVSLLLVAPLPLIIWRIARQVGCPDAVAIAAGIIPMGIPQLLHIGSAVNNDSLMILLFWLLTAVVFRLGTGQIRWTTSALAGLITGLGLLTKGFALIMPLWVAGAIILAWRRNGRGATRSVLTASAVYALTAFAVGGWWWVRNLILFGELAPSRMSEMVPERDSVEVAWGDFLQTWGYHSTRRFWGDFGWYDVALPTPVFAIASILCVVGIVAACLRRDRIAGSPIGDRLLIAAPLILLVALQFALALRGHILTGQLPGLQGRYWFGAIAGAAVIIALGLANLVHRWHRALPLALLLGVGAMQAVAVTTLLGHYWGAPGTGLRSQLRAVVAWAPVPGELIGLGALVAVLAGFTALGQAARFATGRPSQPGGDTDAAFDKAALVHVGHAPEPQLSVGGVGDR